MNDTGRSIAAWLGQTRRPMAVGSVQRLRDHRPDLVDNYGVRGFTELVTDTEIRLEYLIASIRVDRPELFANHVAWLKASFASRGLGPEFLTDHLEGILVELRESMPKEQAPCIEAHFEAARAALAGEPHDLDSLLADGTPHVESARRYLLAVLEGRKADAEAVVRDLLDSNVPPLEVERHVLMAVQFELGRMWQCGEIHPAEEHIATRIAEGLLHVVHERSERQPNNGRTVLVASVGGNEHDLAARLLSQHFELAGWRSLLLGADSPADAIAQSVEDHDVDLVALSTSTTLHVESTRVVIEAIRELPDHGRTMTLVGGLPFRVAPGLHAEIGADGTAAGLPEAVALADRLLSQNA